MAEEPRKKVYVGVSGGVDSAVSAALLKRQGHDVTGVFIRIQVRGLPCPAAQDRLEAQRVAAHLRIPFREIDLSREYETRVFNEMLSSYKRGETPNPDALCNREIKFGLFYDWALAEGADHVATGHYAQIKGPTLDQGSQRSDLGECRLYAGADKEKDQSYFLWDIPALRLAKILFPVGALPKEEVRALARRFGLPNAARKDSQGLCFLGDVPLEEVLRERLKLKDGDVLDEKGGVIGKHRGAALYTIGERHGFELFAQGPAMPPHYVVRKNIRANTITVSPERIPSKAPSKLSLRDTNWLGSVAGGACMARFRYRQPLQSATLAKNKRSVLFEAPQMAAPGQSLVLYLPAPGLTASSAQAGAAQAGENERCLGGGIITSAESRSVGRDAEHRRSVDNVIA